MGRAPLLRCHKKPSTAIYEAGRAFLLLPSVQRPRPLQRLSVMGSPGVNEMQSTVDIPRALCTRITASPGIILYRVYNVPACWSAI